MHGETLRKPLAEPLAITIDCVDPAALSEFWMKVVGGVVEPQTMSDDWVGLREVPVIGHLGFQRVPETKSVKNRVHLDLDVLDLASAVAQAVSLGASVASDVVEEPHSFFQVMRDPEGNEFCFILRRRNL
jgi:predicted enzyme related to lactoylglutathione lyase